MKSIKNKVLIIVLASIFLMFIMIKGSMLYINIFHIGEEVPQISRKSEFSMYENIKYKNIIYKISSVEIVEPGLTYIKPKEGNQFIKVTIEQKNKSKKPAEYSAQSWKMEDDNNNETSRVFTTLDVNTALYGGKLVIGSAKIGTLIFEEPTNQTQLKLNFYDLNHKSKKEKPVFTINIKLDNNKELSKN